ncbi:MAG TPA: twin-arginine translocase TatA/TatE family subunit [bacterium]|nr:twin-arginine translocase TatA/TatE family subunit [bacterium]HDP98106.1 twin-arginine translocase TatA/TatE family subunit [bacterium]
MGIPSGPELIIIVFIILLLFGARKLPELASGLGKGIREFKKATSEAADEEPTKKIPNGEKKEGE